MLFRAFVGLLAVSLCSGLSAETFVVSTTVSSGTGSLRTAINSANTTEGEDVIVFDIPGTGPHTIAIATPLPTVTDALQILNDRAGDEGVTVEGPGTGSVRILTVNSTVTIAGLGFAKGDVSGTTQTTSNAATGGAIRNQGLLVIRNCHFSGNKAVRGGAIFNAGSGGGGGRLSVSHCTFAGNFATQDGGALFDQALLQVRNSTFSSNSAGRGGGIYTEIGTKALTNCTFSDNSASQGGAVFSFADVRTANSIFHRGGSGANVAGALTSLGHNLSDDAAGGDGGTAPGGELDAPGDKRNTDPQLASLAHNGGYTPTHALLPGSPALDAGDDGRAPLVDQRNYTRSGASDIGAFELGGTQAPPPAPTTRTVTNLNDSGVGSLRHALAIAGEGDTIVFAQGLSGVITLTTGELAVDTSVAINGPGANVVAIDGDRASRVALVRSFFVPRLTVTISGLTIRGGRHLETASGSGGGGILNEATRLTVQDCVVSDNETIGRDYLGVQGSVRAFGGGIASTVGMLELINTAVINNTATGGNGDTTAGNTARAEGEQGAGGGIGSMTPLTLTNCIISGNVARGGDGVPGAADGVISVGRGIGGGLYTTSPTVITGSRIEGNSAVGGRGREGGYGGPGLAGGIAVESSSVRAADMTITTSTVRDNTAVGGPGGDRATSGNGGRGGYGFGGGLFLWAGGGASTLKVLSSTFSGNAAVGGKGGQALSTGGAAGSGGDAFGGAFQTNTQVDNYSVVVENSTLTNNNATGGTAGANGAANGASEGGAIADMRSAGQIVNSTISDNSAGRGGNLALGSGTPNFVLHNTIVARGVAQQAPDISGAVAAQSSFNLVGDGTGATGIADGSNGNKVGTSSGAIDPRLGPLQDNGGPTQTRALLPDSPAINAADHAKAPPTDQRGVSRAGTADIGAFEFTDGSSPTPTPTPSATPTRFGNIATRLRVETGENVLIGGFIVTGSAPKKLMIRAIGPSLTVAGRLANPVLELYGSDGNFIVANDNWDDAPNRQEIIDSTIPPSDPLEAAILRNLAPGAYTALVRGAADGTGIGVIEVYDLGGQQESKLANISTRGRVQTGDDVMIAGFILVGSDARKVIVRAIGPSLPLATRLGDPVLELFDGEGNPIAQNDNWRETQQDEVNATGIPPTDDRESAIVRTLAPAAYTAIVRGAGETTGVALIEVYALSP